MCNSLSLFIYFSLDPVLSIWLHDDGTLSSTESVLDFGQGLTRLFLQQSLQVHQADPSVKLYTTKKVGASRDAGDLVPALTLPLTSGTVRIKGDNEHESASESVHTSVRTLGWQK